MNVVSVEPQFRPDSTDQAQGSPKVKKSTARRDRTYCFPSIANDIGDEYTDAPH